MSLSPGLKEVDSEWAAPEFEEYLSGGSQVIGSQPGGGACEPGCGLREFNSLGSAQADIAKINLGFIDEFSELHGADPFVNFRTVCNRIVGSYRESSSSQYSKEVNVRVDSAKSRAKEECENFLSDLSCGSGLSLAPGSSSVSCPVDCPIPLGPYIAPCGEAVLSGVNGILSGERDSTTGLTNLFCNVYEEFESRGRVTVGCLAIDQ